MASITEALEATGVVQEAVALLNEAKEASRPLDEAFYRDEALEPVRAKLAAFFAGFQNIPGGFVDWESFKTLYPCVLPPEAILFDLPMSFPKRVEVCMRPWSKDRVEIDPALREEYKAFLGMCVVPADTTLAGFFVSKNIWIRTHARDVDFNGAIIIHGYARNRDFRGDRLPCFRVAQDVQNVRYLGYDAEDAFVSIDVVGPRSGSSLRPPYLMEEMSTCQINRDSHLSERALMYLWHSRFMPRWVLLRKYTVLREYLEAMLGGAMHTWFAVYHAIMFEIEVCGIMTSEGRRIVSPYHWAGIVDGTSWTCADMVTRYDPIDGDIPSICDRLLNRRDKRFVMPQVSDEVYMLLMHGPVFEATWRLQVYPNYVHHARFMGRGQPLGQPPSMASGMAILSEIWPYHDFLVWPQGYVPSGFPVSIVL